MIPRSEWKSYYTDKLVLRVIATDGRRISQGKRVNVDPGDKEIVNAYVRSGVVAAVKMLHRRGLSLKDCIDYLDKLRGCDKSNSWREA